MAVLYHNKGWSSRTPAEQTALCVRIFYGRHAQDLEEQVQAMLGERRPIVGRVDMTRNPLRSACDRVNRAYQRPPLVNGITPAHLRLCADASSSVLVKKYAAVGGLPLATTHQAAAREVLGLYLAATYAGLMVGWSARRQCVVFEPVTPDDLSAEYAGDDPAEPTVIEHRRQRWQGDRFVAAIERYDLTNPDAPKYSVTAAGDTSTDLTPAPVVEAGGWPDEWRDAAGRPIHRIVLLGRPGQPYATQRLVEASLRVPALWSHWAAGIVDAGHPSRHAMGLRPAGSASDARTGQQGAAGGPEAIHLWDHVDPERPGTLQQFGPGFDPKLIGEALQDYELGAMNSLGLPIAMSGTGGEPTVQEEAAAERAAALHYPLLRRMDAQALQLVEGYLASVDKRPPVDIAAGILYGDEVEAALVPPEITTEDPTDG